MGSRRDDPAVINSTNVFAALGTLRKKKKSSSSAAEKDSSSSKTKSSKNKEAEKAVFWAPTPITTKLWADVEDEEEDDYYATTAPPQAVWGAADPVDSKPTSETVEVEESETEDEGPDEVDDDVEEEHENEHEPEAPVEVEPVKKIPEASVAPKDTERQLSKKELKKKGLEELDAVLAELGYIKQETSGQDNSHGDIQEKKIETNGEAEKKENAPGESKSAKKKKKKDKSSKESKEPQELPHGADVGEGTEESAEPEKPDDASATDVKERLKKVVSLKKKKSSKEMDAAARAAASEAAARNARLAAAKKKEKNHYNQQPVR